MEIRQTEAFAYEVVRRVLGVEVEHVDDNQTHGHWDALITYPDGRHAALEVTTLADPRGMELRSMGHKLPVESEHAWDLRYPPTVRMKTVRAFVPRLVAWCDRFDISEPYSLPFEYLSRPEMVWYEGAEVDLQRMETSSLSGMVYVLPEGVGGVVDERLEGLSRWVETQLVEPWYVDNVAKLERSGLAELHLLALVVEDGVDFAIYDGLTDSEPIVPGSTSELGSLTSLWLLPSHGQHVTRWTSETGWMRQRYEDKTRPLQL